MTTQKSLAELQNALQDFLLDKRQDASDLTLETPAFSRKERLHIYHQAYRLRLLDALRNDYPALEAFIGEDNFVVLTNDFIAANPSQHPSLRWLGEKLPQFIREHSTWNSQVAAIELAEFEWAQVMAFDAADIQCATLSDARALAPEQWMNMGIQFHPSVQSLNFYTNAPQVWNKLIKDNEVITAELYPHANTWLVWRDELQVVYRPLEKPEAWALNAFAHQQKFADICAGLCEWYPETQVPMQAAQYLQHWLNAGLVIAILSD